MKHLLKFPKDKHGYSLVELMVVVAIMAILAGASTPVFTGYIKKAKSSEYLMECRAVSMAAEASLISMQDRFTGSDQDFEEMENEMEALTDLNVEIIGKTDDGIEGAYGAVIVKTRSGEWKCEAVTCFIEKDLWIYDLEDGTFNEKK